VLGVFGIGQGFPVRFTIFARVRGLSAAQPWFYRPRRAVGFDRRGRVAGRQPLQPLPKFVSVA
jgi:hypothetical protein